MGVIFLFLTLTSWPIQDELGMHMGKATKKMPLEQQNILAAYKKFIPAAAFRAAHS